VDLNNLKTSISNLSDEELRKVVMDIRSSRRTPKTSGFNSTQKAKKVTTKKENPVSLDALLASASPEQIASIIAALEAK
jgi:hypothetical protein